LYVSGLFAFEHRGPEIAAVIVELDEKSGAPLRVSLR
jgi:hypothetical protein